MMNDNKIEEKYQIDSHRLLDPVQSAQQIDSQHNRTINADISMRSDEGRHLNPSHLPSTNYHLLTSQDLTTQAKIQSSVQDGEVRRSIEIKDEPEIEEYYPIKSESSQKADSYKGQNNGVPQARDEIVPAKQSTIFENKSRDMEDVTPRKTASNLDSKKEGGGNSIYLKVKDEIERKSTRNSTPKSLFEFMKLKRKNTNTPLQTSLTNKQLDLVDDKSEIYKRSNSMNTNDIKKKKKFQNVIAKLASKSKSPQGKLFTNVFVSRGVMKGEEEKYCGKLFKHLLKIVGNIHFPDSRLILFWHFLSVIMLMVDIFYIPFLLSYLYDKGHIIIGYIDYPLFIYFILNFGLNFNTAYYSKGIVVTKRRKIIKHYIKKRFALDLITILVSVARIVFKSDIMIYWEMIRVLRILNLRYHVGKLEDYLQLSFQWLAIIRLLKLWVFLVIIAHFVACTYHYIARNNADEENWLEDKGLTDSGISRRYIASIYWSVATIVTVGYGDIKPLNDAERLFATFCMLIATAIFGYTMNTIGNIVSELDEYKGQAKLQIRRATNYMKQKNLDKDIQSRVRKFLEYILDGENHQRSMEQDFLVQTLSGHLKDEVLAEIYGKTLRDCELFRLNNFSRRFLADASYCFKEVFLSPEQPIFQEGDNTDLSIYFITRGKVHIYYEKCRKIIKTLSKGSYFGEISFFSCMPRSASAKSLNFSNTFKLNRTDFLNVINHYRVDKEQFYQIQDTINLYENYKVVKVACYTCNQEGHIAKNCPKLHMFVDKMAVIKNILAEEEEERSSFTRKFLKSFNARADNSLIVSCGHQIQKYYNMNQIENFFMNLNNVDINTHSSIEDIYDRKIYAKTTANRQNERRRNSWLDQDASSIHFSEFLQKRDFVSKFTDHRIGSGGRVESNTNLQNEFYDAYHDAVSIDKVQNYENYFPHNNIQRLIVDFEQQRLENYIKSIQKGTGDASRISKLVKRSFNIMRRHNYYSSNNNNNNANNSFMNGDVSMAQPQEVTEGMHKDSSGFQRQSGKRSAGEYSMVIKPPRTVTSLMSIDNIYDDTKPAPQENPLLKAQQNSGSHLALPQYPSGTQFSERRQSLLPPFDAHSQDIQLSTISDLTPSIGSLSYMDKSQGGYSYIYGGPSHSMLGNDLNKSSFLSVPRSRRGSHRKEPKVYVTPAKGVLDGLQSRRRSIMSKQSSLHSVSEVEEGLGDFEDNNNNDGSQIRSSRKKGQFPPTLANVDAAKFTNDGRHQTTMGVFNRDKLPKRTRRSSTTPFQFQIDNDSDSDNGGGVMQQSISAGKLEKKQTAAFRSREVSPSPSRPDLSDRGMGNGGGGDPEINNLYQQYRGEDQ